MLHCRVCLTHTAIAPAAGRSVRSKATLPVDTVSVRVSRPIAHRHHAARCSPITLQRSTIPVSTDSVAPPSSKPTHGNVHSKNPQRSISPASQAALHPLRGATPNQKGCNACGSGAVPTDRVQCPPQQPQLRATPAHTPYPAVPDAATQPRDARPSSGLASQQKRSRNYTRYGAVHPLRGATPEQKRCNADGSGAVPPRQEQKRAAVCQQLDNVARAVPRSCRKLGGAPRCPPSSDTTDRRTVSIPHQVVTGRGRCSAALRH